MIDIFAYMKSCIVCGNANPKSWHGRKCSKCWELDNKARHQTPKHRYGQAMRDAKKRNKKWELTLKEYSSIIEGACYYCNNNMLDYQSFGVGLDRLDNSQGYHLANVVSCCKVCNIIRGNFLSVEETTEVVKALLDYRNNKNYQVPQIETPLTTNEAIIINRNHKLGSRFSYAKKHARYNKKIWDISLSDFQRLILEPCYYCNNNLGPLIENCGCGLDRIDNNQGYTLNNVLPCCTVCNSRRNKYLSVEENKIAATIIIKSKLDKVSR